MNEEKKMEELKEILEKIQNALELYNQLNPVEKMTITPQEEKKDVSDIFVCVYNERHVGLFKKINWHYKRSGRDRYDAGSIYKGIHSDYVGMKQTHDAIISTNRWSEIGTKVSVGFREYVANCNMQNGMSFDDMRLLMYQEGQISPYEIGKASSQEMLEVLKYATHYYQLDQNLKNQRKR